MRSPMKTHGAIVATRAMLGMTQLSTRSEGASCNLWQRAHDWKTASLTTPEGGMPSSKERLLAQPTLSARDAGIRLACAAEK
jgi:hypothetical protein